MPTNETRRELLNRAKASGFPGSITEVFQAADQGIDLIEQHQMQQQQEQEMQVANTPEQQETGLREQHAMGNTQASMAFPDVQPNQSFNTVGMEAPIDIQKIDNQGHLVESYKNVPPGIQDLPTGPSEGTIIESPAAYQKGGLRNHMMDYLHNAGADTTYANNVMNAVGQHESNNVADKKQDSYKYIKLPPDVNGVVDSVKTRYDGPGRGAYQFEMGTKKGASTAFNRSALFTRDSTSTSFSKFPSMYPEALQVSPDFSGLSKEDQDGLFLGDKMNRGKKAVKSFYDLIKKDGTPPTQEEVFKILAKKP